ncbi:nodulation protein NfeD [Sporosarcina thermotolerans]|uniref:Nodulation protein NfeD n=2 Tax=Sporosarcina thermotolerans TaxID=633404 RepID=A0AAW9A731_9BACL|nr:nodulation protein NfeD [Sporosarcina thermotolerans]MDW0117391.1 nodulation protein NfeD [Sporosarcina thermotolerans]WHT47528.1 nodulation protein NfeD [Sporosarcina thermotolerans]
MHKMIGKFILFILFLSMISVPFAQTSAAVDKVYHVKIDEAVEKGLYAYLKRSFREAEDANAKAIILEINTNGGFTDAAGEIAKLMSETEPDIIAFINYKAISAGAYIALYADQIYMSPNGKIGAAQVIEGSGNAADDKAHSLWVAEMKSAAESHGRNPEFAIAMAEPSVDLEQYRAGPGKLLTLTASEAVSEEVGYSEGTVSSLDELLKLNGLQDAEIIATKVSFAEGIVRFITHPIVVPILLSIAGLGLVVELYSPGFGVPGTMAISSLMLFFFGHLIAGLAGYETLILFGIGVILIILELFLPGGIAGTLGAIAVVVSIILAGGNPMYMAYSVLIAIAVAVIGMVIIMKFFGKRLHLLNKMVLMDSTDTDSGYVSNVNRTELLGKKAKTITPLRPAGTIDMNGERIDVVSQGSYIDKGKHVIIVKVEGSRIVVRESEKKGENE